MKETVFENNKIVKSHISIKVKEIKDDFCAFKAVLTIVEDGKSRTLNSEGISTLSAVEKAHQDCKLPHRLTNFIKSNDEFLELIRCYGFPESLSEKDKFNDGSMPEVRMRELMEDSEIKFDDVNDELLENLLWVNRSSYTIIKLMKNEFCNIAQNAEDLFIHERRYNNYENIIEQMIKDKRIFVRLDRRGNIYQEHWGETLKYVDGRISFTDEEFKMLTSGIDVNSYIDKYEMGMKIKEMDLFNIKEFEKTSADVEY